MSGRSGLEEKDQFAGIKYLGSIYRDVRGSAWNIPPLLTLTGDRKSKEKCKHNREESKSSNMFCVVKEMIYGRGNLGIISKDGKCSQKRRLKNLCPRIT